MVRPTPSWASGVHAVIVNATAVIINGAMVLRILRMPVLSLFGWRPRRP